MDMSILRSNLDELANQARSLALDSVNHPGDGEAHLASVAELTQKLDLLRLEIDAAPAAERGALNNIWQGAQSNLMLVAAVAAPPQENSLLARAREINERAFSLAKLCAAKRDDPQGLFLQAQALRQEMVSLVGQPGHSAAEVQNLLGEANLDILYVLSEGKAPSSLRLHHYQSGSR
jgi:hypothetical protein